jgi:hypothetical protein
VIEVIEPSPGVQGSPIDALGTRQRDVDELPLVDRLVELGEVRDRRHHDHGVELQSRRPMHRRAVDRIAHVRVVALRRDRHSSAARGEELLGHRFALLLARRHHANARCGRAVCIGAQASDELAGANRSRLEAIDIDIDNGRGRPVRK